MSELDILPRDREYLLARRQAILIELGAIERRLDMKRSVIPNHQRKDSFDGQSDRRSSACAERNEKGEQ